MKTLTKYKHNSKLTKFESFLRNYFKFERDYFTVGGALKEFSYFISQGNIVSHVIDRVKFRIFPKLLIVPDFPTHIDIEAASSCQMRCPMCYTTYMPDEIKGLMKWDLYVKLVDEVAIRGVYSIKLSWRGEPLLNNRIIDMIKYAKEKGIKEVSLLTNAELMTAKMAEAIVDSGLDWISISADGTKAVYDEIRAPAVFEETLSKVQYLKDYRNSLKLAKPLIRVQSILSAVEDPDEYINSWKNKVDRINIISDQIRDYETRTDQEYDPYYMCPKPWTRINVAHDGKIHQCGADYSGKLIIGDTNSQSLYEIWHGAESKKIRNAFINHTYLDDLPACRNCSYGLIQEKNKVGSMTLQKYKSVPKVVEGTTVKLRTPDEMLTPRVKKKIIQIHAQKNGEQ
jgi:radical SAM protein with 4Fe4S-binding SPASM domain